MACCRSAAFFQEFELPYLVASACPILTRRSTQKSLEGLTRLLTGQSPIIRTSRTTSSLTLTSSLTMPDFSLLNGATFRYRRGETDTSPAVEIEHTEVQEVRYGTGEGSSSRHIGSSDYLVALGSPESPPTSFHYHYQPPSSSATRARLPSPTRFVYRSRSPSPTRHRSYEIVGVILDDPDGSVAQMVSSRLSRSVSTSSHRQHSHAPSVSGRTGSIFGSEEISTSRGHSRSGTTSFGSRLRSALGSDRGTSSRSQSTAPSNSRHTYTSDYDSTHTRRSEQDTTSRYHSGAPSSSCHGSEYRSGQSTPKASSYFRTSAAPSSSYDSHSCSRTARATDRATERDHYFIPGEKSSSSTSRSNTTRKHDRPTESHNTKSSSSHSRAQSSRYDSSSRDTVRPSSRTDGRSTHATSSHRSTSNHHSTSHSSSHRPTSNTDGRSTMGSSRFESVRSTRSDRPKNHIDQLKSLFDAYEAKWSKLGRTDKKYPLPASTHDLFKLDFSAFSCRSGNWSNEEIFVANVQLIYLAGFGIPAYLKGKSDSLCVDINIRGTSSNISNLKKWLSRTEAPRFHPDRMNLRTGAEGVVDDRISKRIEVVAMRTAVQKLLALLGN